MTPGPGIARTLLPLGFVAGGVNSGVRRYRPDLGIIISEDDAVATAMFTQNECKAAPLLYSQALVPTTHARAIVTNSGQANAATGPEGKAANFMMASAAAQAVGCHAHQVLTASTGVIGVPLDTGKIVAAMPELISRAVDVAEPFALAILTTDLVPNTVTTAVQLSGGQARITGICKGSGMIHPNMATMLGYLLTDAAVTMDQARSLLADATNRSFNMISVDGETSTNDTVFFMANGASGVALKTKEDVALFAAALGELAQILAKSIARDGEGSTKLIEVNLRGAPDLEMARKAARSLTVSPLIKTAIHGEDPNWGRVLARLGAERIPQECLGRLSLAIQGTKLYESGAPTVFSRGQLGLQLKHHTVTIEIDLASGPFDATAWGCDLSRKYVEINAEYST